MTIDETDSPIEMITEVCKSLKEATEDHKCAFPSRHEGILKNEAGYPIGAYLYERMK